MGLEKNVSTRRFWKTLLILLLSVVWTGWQMYAFSHQFSYRNYAREICGYVNLKNAGTESDRLAGVLCYLQSLPHILAAYCLLTKFPPKDRRQLVVRILIVAGFFLLSLLFYPPLAMALFPSIRSGMLSVNKTHCILMVGHTLLGLLAVPVAAVTVYLRNPHRGSSRSANGRRRLASAGRYGTVFLLAWITAIAYGYALGVLAHFNEAAARAVPRNFMHDTSLYSGLISMVIAAPLVEEFGYRGMIFSKLKQHTALLPALLLSSAMFAIWHRNLGQIVATFPMGLLFAGVYHRSGKLRYSISLHALSNLLTLLSLASSGSLLPHISLLTKMRAASTGASLPTAILGLVLCACAAAFLLCRVFPVQKENA